MGEQSEILHNCFNYRYTPNIKKLYICPDKLFDRDSALKYNYLYLL